MPVRSVLLAAALAVMGAGIAQAQSPFPGPQTSTPASPGAPASSGASPWPSVGNNTPPAAPAGASPWPSATSGAPASPFPAGPGAGPGGPGPGPGGGLGPSPSPFGQPQAQPPAVCNNFVEIRAAAEKGALAIRAATGRKAPPPELCPLFKNYNATEAKMLKFMTDNKTTCGVPDQVIGQVKASFTKTAQITKQVCNPQAAAGGRAKPPSLGEALGTPAVPTGNNTKTGRGTYDTLSGSNPLAR